MVMEMRTDSYSSRDEENFKAMTAYSVVWGHIQILSKQTSK